MNKIEELLKNLCPNGVEYKKLWNVTEWDKKFNGTTKEQQRSTCKFNHISANELKSLEDNSGKIKLLSTGNYDGYTTEEKAGKNINSGEIFTIPSGGTANIKYYNGLFIDSGNIIGKSNDVNKYSTKYIYYWLLNNYIEIQSFFRGSGVKHPDMVSILNMSIPVPPLEVQCEIVHILDDFTLLSAELKARQKQYQFYLNNLLDIEKLKPQKIMYVKDLFEIKNGLNKEKGAFGKGTPIVNFTDVYKNRYLTKNMLKGKVTLNEGEIKRYAVEKGDVFFTRTSETKEDIGMSSTVIEDIEKCTFSGFVLRARPTTDLLIPKFCAYYFSTNKVRDTIIRYASFTTRATTSGPKLAKIPVPIISIKEQEKIVNILDRFDKLCNDISEGLPAEIEARQKQYEYYRDKLLTFKELKVNE